MFLAQTNLPQHEFIDFNKFMGHEDFHGLSPEKREIDIRLGN